VSAAFIVPVYLYEINILYIYVNIPIYIYSTVTYLVNEKKKKQRKEGSFYDLSKVNTASGARGGEQRKKEIEENDFGGYIVKVGSPPNLRNATLDLNVARMYNHLGRCPYPVSSSTGADTADLKSP
jgi:hypothetical protein